MNCIVFKMSENLRGKLSKFYEPFKLEKHPPYSIFQAKNFDVTITLYESGKVMFQGIGADIEASIWIDAEKRLNNKVINIDEKKEKKDKKDNDSFFLNSSTIGSDETGCGDVFGPVIVAASYVEKKDIEYLRELGVKDSKQITDEKIREIAPQIIKNIPYTCITLNNPTYNQNYHDINMVKLKCILHNKVLCSLIEKYNPTYTHCVVDQFVNEKKYYEYLSAVPKKVTNISFYTKGESKCMAVAAASIIARYFFLNEMEKLEKEFGYALPKGAGSLVDSQVEKIIKEKGKDYLNNFAKMNFKNISKY